MLITGLAWLTIGLGGLDMFQFIKGLLDKGKVNSALAQLERIRAMCNEAVARGEAINTDPARAFIRCITDMILGVERGLKGIKTRTE